MEIKKFLKDVAKNTPTPGGGSVIALTGALSASLISMVSGVSVNRGKLKERELEKMKRDSLIIQERLYRAINEDADSFDAVIEALRLPRSSKAEIRYRNREIMNAYKKAILIPKLVCEKSIKLMELSRILIKQGNPNATSDVSISALLADSAFRGGLLNIIANLKFIKNKIFQKKIYRFIKNVKKKRDSLMKDIQESIYNIYKLD